MLEHMGEQLYYDRQHNPITMSEWVELSGNRDYKIIGADNIGEYYVSTVWLGLDHSFLENATPVIFETMIFGPDWIWANQDMHEYQERYASEAAAIEGHERAVALVLSHTRQFSGGQSG